MAASQSSSIGKLHLRSSGSRYACRLGHHQSVRAFLGRCASLVMVPGSNLLFVAGMFFVGWVTSLGTNRTEPLAQKEAALKVAAKEAAMAAAPPEAVAAELAALNEAEEAENKKDA